MIKMLLLTGCIHPKGSILSKVSWELELSKRITQYERAIRYYIQESPFQTIVFCDNSDFHHVFIEEMSHLAREKGKIFEYITYDGNKKSSVYGYGYSECELIDYAWENSGYLRTSSSWYKISGRYILRDVERLIDVTRNLEFYFHKQGIFDSWFTVSTSFFLMSNNLYESHLYKKHTLLYEKLHREKKQGDLIVNGSIPVEKIWYLLLREYIKTYKSSLQHSTPVYYVFPSSVPSWFPEQFGEFLRRMLYFFYYFFHGDRLFSPIHSIYDDLFFEKNYSHILMFLKNL